MRILAALLGRRNCKTAAKTSTLKKTTPEKPASEHRLFLAYPFYLHSRAPIKL